MCYYFDDLIKFSNFDIENYLTDGKSYGNFLIYDNSYKILISAKPFSIKVR